MLELTVSADGSVLQSRPLRVTPSFTERIQSTSSGWRFSPAEAVLAYDESLAAVQYISDTYGMSDLRRIMEKLAEGSSTEAALRSVIRSDYGQMEAEVGKYLNSRYGE